jgi:quinol monooxygenase YgiN
MESTHVRAAGLVGAALVLGMSCAAEPAPAKSASQHAAQRAMPAAAAVVTHAVEDYTVWKRAFDEHSEARKRAGIVGTHINRSTDDPNLLTLYLAAGDAAALQAFLASEELASTMQRAGVKGPPVIAFITPVEDQTLKDRPLPGALIKHRVSDYERWKKAFDAHAAARARAGVVGQAVNRSVDDPNLILLYIQATSFELLKAFLESADLKQAMTNAGVEGPPEIALVQGAEWGP